jgi:hypothetical protein
MRFSHFIITQFNLRNFPLSQNNDYNRWIEWTRERIQIFRQYCLPSMLNQSCKSFTWLLFFDQDTPAEFNDFINYLKTYSFISICYAGGVEDFNGGYANEIKVRTAATTPWIITSRIDNDDCLHKDAVKVIQDNFAERHKYLISLASGYILNLEDKKLSHYYYPMSPFISLVESTDFELEGVFQKGHTRWDALRLFITREIRIELFSRKKRKSRFILEKPMWIQLIHGKNVSNDFYRGLPVLRSKNLIDYAINYSSNPQKLSIIFRYMDYVTWKRYFKSLVVRTLLRK